MLRSNDLHKMFSLSLYVCERECGWFSSLSIQNSIDCHFLLPPTLSLSSVPHFYRSSAHFYRFSVHFAAAPSQLATAAHTNEKETAYKSNKDTKYMRINLSMLRRLCVCVFECVCFFYRIFGVREHTLIYLFLDGAL